MSRPIGMATPTVEELEAEIEHLRSALERIANLRPGYSFPDPRDIAREALSDE